MVVRSIRSGFADNSCDGLIYGVVRKPLSLGCSESDLISDAILTRSSCVLHSWLDVSIVYV